MVVTFIYVTEIVKYILFFKYCLKEDIQKIWLGFIGFCIYDIVVRFNVPIEFTAVGIVIVTMFFMIKKSGLKLCGKIIISAVLLDCMAEMLMIFVKRGTGYLGNVKWSKTEYYLLTNFVLILILVIWIFLIKVLKREQKKNYISVYVVYTVLGVVVFFLVFTVGLLEYLTDYIQYPFLLRAIDIFSVCAFFSILVLLIVIIYIFDMNDQLKESYETEKIMKEAQKVYYETLLKKEEETVRYRHDISNHILCLQEMARANQIEEMQNYVHSMSEQLKEINNIAYDTGNIVLSIMLNYYVGNLRKKAKIYVTGKVNNDIAINDYDLCTIFSNIFKNAIEEINRNNTENLILYINIENGKSNVKVEVGNTSTEKEIKDGIVKTTKVDAKNHGIGLKNIKATVEKYGGIYELSYSDEMFVIKLYLPFYDKLNKK